MANTPEAISYIKLDDGLDPHPIDAMTVGNKSAEQIGELVTSIDSNSTDIQYPSAKCVYEIIYGEIVAGPNAIWLTEYYYDPANGSGGDSKGAPGGGLPEPDPFGGGHYSYDLDEVGTGWDVSDLTNNPPILYVKRVNSAVYETVSGSWSINETQVIFTTSTNTLYLSGLENPSGPALLGPGPL